MFKSKSGDMEGSKANEPEVKKPKSGKGVVLSILLWICIFFIPWVFSWFTLRKGYGIVSRVVALGWLGLMTLALVVGDEEKLPEVVATAEFVAKVESEAVAKVEPEVVAKVESEAVAKVKSFCYALQASMVCDDLKLRLDTEAKIEKEVGGKFRGVGSVFGSTCLNSIGDVPSRPSANFCKKVWSQYGCQGTVIPRLLQQNPFTLKNPMLCEY